MEQINNLDYIGSMKPSSIELYSSTFRTGSLATPIKTIEFFEHLYKYPDNVKINWEGLNNFKQNFANPYPAPFDNIFKNQKLELSNQSDFGKRYSFSDFLLSYKSKTATSAFYSEKTKAIQNGLQNIPVYTILNGRGELVVANSFSKLKNKGTKTNIEGKFYDFCGTFDTKTRGHYHLGFFFMDRQAAEIYLKEIAKADIKGSKNLGLSVNCIGLDSAYLITREQHPGIDFRFIPKLSELKKLFAEQIKKSNVSLEKGQMHGSARPKFKVIRLETLIDLGNWISPFSNFLQYSEYYKGVPIYVAQFKDRFDNNKLEDYVFFEKDQVSNFCKKNKSKLTLRSKILTYNLEDFIEKWEDSIKEDYFPTYLSQTRPILNSKNINFIAINDSFEDLEDYSSSLKTSRINIRTKKVKQFFSVKYRTFLSFFDILINFN
jgi:hypothetical protein